MATTAPSPVQLPPSTANKNQQKRPFFRSISRFLSGGTSKARPKLPNNQQPSSSHPAQTYSPSASPGPETNGDEGRDSHESEDEDDNGVALREVRGNSVSTRSLGGLSGSTSSSALEDHGRGGRGADTDGESAISGADTDASIRPISPTSLAPSTLSHAHTASSSTNNSVGARTFKSYASRSTKPTTLLSIDSGGGANRIAVVPGTGGPVVGQSPVSTSFPTSTSANSLSPLSNPGITFSSLPNSESSPPSPDPTTQVPHHTVLHPRNNPHPASPPPDNASMLTLASSSFAPSIHFPRSGGTSLLRAHRGVYEADEDASVRALAGSRRASDESLGSRSTWSAAITGSKAERAASLRTVGTGEEGGEETEAQKVVRNVESGEDPDVTSGEEGADTPTEEEEKEVELGEGKEEGGTATPSTEATSTSVDGSESEADGVQTPKKLDKGKGKAVLGDEESVVTDTQSFVDAQSVAEKTE
ncbi:hypothetical protein MNV49_005821 [Pseudohyphozyma bogoriensis]|nr:hypothetical protein MNV49_005821 [Pseudohyphozyma bogoriensis]